MIDKNEYKLILEALNAYLDDDESYNVEIRQLIKKIISKSDNQFKSWLNTCPFEYDIIYDGSNAIEDKVDWTGQVDLAIYTQTKQ